MKVIIISDALDEPYEMDSKHWQLRHLTSIGYGYAVKDKIDALLEMEKMHGDKDRHSIFTEDQP